MQSFSEPESLYARVLAANDRGRAFLRERKKDEKTHIPVISNSVRALKDNCISPRAKKMLAFDMKAAAIYQMKAAKNRCYDRTDFIRSPFVNLQEKSNFT